MLTTTYELDIVPGGVPQVITASQYDANSRNLAFNLYSSTGNLSLPSGTQAAIRGTKPDGNGFDYDATITGTTVTFTVTEQMTAIAGRVMCEIYLYSGTAGSTSYKQIATANFILYVERAAMDKDTLISGSEIRQLVDIMDNSAEIIAAASLAATSAANAAQSASDAAQDAAAASSSATEASTSAGQAAVSAADAADVLAAATTVIHNERDAAISAVDTSKAAAIEEAETVYEQQIESLLAVKSNADEMAAAAIQSAHVANTLSAQALAAAGNAENDIADVLATVDQQQDRINAQQLQIDGKVDGGYVEDGVAYFTAGDQVLFEITGIGGGGGSGGGSGNNAIITMTNTSGWMSKTVAQNDACPVSFNWSSLEDQVPTGNGSLRIQVSGITKTTLEVAQGDITVDVASYLSTGANTVSLTVSDIYGNNRTIRITVTVVALTLTSSFDASTPYTGAISFPYTPTGSVQKTVHFILDGTEIGTQVTSVSGRQQSYTITQQSHGAHTLRVYFEAEINGQTVRSNELYYEIICLEPMVTTPVITSSFRETTAAQYAQLSIDYKVYSPSSLTTPVTVKVNGTTIAMPTVDRSSQVISYRPGEAGTLTVSVETGTAGSADYASKTWTLTITETQIDVEAETEGLALYLTAEGRSNAETTTREDWHYEDIAATLTGFNWRINGWMQDSDGADVLRLNDDARVTIPYQIFGTDFKNTGKTIEVEFATREVADYDADILSCAVGATEDKTVSGNPVSVADALTLPAQALRVSIAPIQDLHGYGRAWPPGGGNNLLDPGSNETIAGITKTVNADGSITFSGTATSTADFYFNGTTSSGTVLDVTAGNYHLMGTEDGSASTYQFFLIYVKSGTTSYANGHDHQTVALDSSTTSRLFFRVYNGVTVNITARLALYSGAYVSDEAWEPSANICPITGADAVTVTRTGGGETATVNIPLGRTVYGGTLDVVSGTLSDTMAVIASYAGETLPGRWLSDRDAYAAGATPTIGAQVVYELVAPVTYQLTPQAVALAMGANIVSTDAESLTLTYTAEATKQSGLRITPQAVYFNGAQTSISTLYKENEHIRLTITVGKQSEYRLILIYINGIMSRAIQYASGERFDQLTPVGITIGSNDCGIDIYNIRVYDQDLSDRGVLDNWIADTQDGGLMQDRYTRNNVYSAGGDITIATMPTNLPYMVIEATELPQYKGDKKTVSGRYVDPVDPSKSFTFTGCQINVQGTSSAIYYRKNWDLQFKQGFTLPNGTTATNYALRSGSIPFNRFVLKADVASSESANNTGLTMYYNDICPYKTPAMLADNRVRWGIEGVPIALFWYNPDTGETVFLGKHNFNLPKRAPAPYGYTDGDTTMESWEFERNNSDNVKFKDFNITDQTWDEVEQAYYPTWYDDWEARFPSDEWRDTAKLGELVRWVVSTDRAQATNETLDAPVTYTVSTTATLNGYEQDDSYTVTEITQDGARTGYSITFTKDTPAYRLTKFRAEAAQYMVLDSAVFYYIFTHQFLMIDSRAKNMFVGFNGDSITGTGRAIDKLATFQPYDMDTALGTNNSGVLMFGYSLEDTDTVSAVISGEGGSDAPVYNAQDSVLWVNVRDAFRSEITAMYRTLRSGNLFNYSYIEQWFEQHQSKWSEAIFNEDARTKYLVPLIDPVTVDDETGQLVRTDRYLTMLQGSKAEQRKWWLYNRFRYMDSKYNTGDASKTINMRLFNGGTLTITPVIDLYVGVSFGGGTTPDLKRTTAETPVTFTYTAPSGVTEMETWIYSADLIADVGDLSGFYPNELDFSRATRLRRLKIGSAASGYTNNNLTTINVQNSSLLEHIDCRNCPRLAITVNLEGSPRLKEAYFDGTSITGVELADGATVETLHLPATITTLTLLNLNKLSDLTLASVAGVTRLMLANIDQDILNPMDVLQAIPANSQVYIEGLHFEAADADEIEDFLDLLDTMRGVTREKSATGEWMYHDYDTAQVSGTIHTSSLTGAQIASYNARYPYITVTADHTTSYLRYYSWDGETLLNTETIQDGGDGTYSGTPSRTATAQYTYSFVGWNTTTDAQTASASATQNVVADRDVYAAYSRTVRTYTVTFARNSADGGGTLQTVTDVPYGGSATYTGETPTTTQGDATDYPFEGWSPTPTNITGNTTCYAVFGSPLEVVEITDSWDDIIAACNNGTYATKYKVGNYKPLDLGTEGVVNMQIVAKDEDPLASGTGNAPLTWVSMELLSSTHRMNPDIAYNNKSVPSFTANGNTWTSQNRYTVSKAKATWTLTATSAGTVSINYKTSNATASRNKITTLTVNGTAVATNYTNTTGATHTVEVGVGDEVVVYCEYDLLGASYSYYATITFSSTGTFTTVSNVENADTRDSSSGVSGTGTIGGWENTEMRSYMKDTIKPLIPSEVRSAIKEVTKYTIICNTSVDVVNNVPSTDDVWIPSYREIFGGTSYETSGPVYTTVFSDTTSRIKKCAGSAAKWWLRSAYAHYYFHGVSTSGSYIHDHTDYAYGVALGFCT